MTIAAYQTLYESSVAFGMRKALQAEQGKAEMERKVCSQLDKAITPVDLSEIITLKFPVRLHYIRGDFTFSNSNGCTSVCFQITELEQDKRDLERQVNELKAKCEQIEKRATEQRQVEEKKHAEEIQFLKRTNQQLKVRGNK